ncbi:uncharacterized protein BP5553_09158 [Venustampulla echinocandica]|uniref:DUF7703 domain-containing protein n=1 Tax=Venustampulla echinocandica TaxID=2656787 RepID=A0A370TE32_9HELO|nr:uncharacterized protein BP5553_09158 [Venustampulla echinocandica]RDL32702.1 hypothetical protein BP5553_09158 [Venustampulla echinocandica]
MSSPPGLLFGPLDTVALVFIFIGFSAIAMYNSVEVFGRIFIVFKRYTGVYFYSLIVATLGIAFYQTFIVLMILTPWNTYVVNTGGALGWAVMVTAQSVVLWSRLHLVLRNPRVLRWVLGMIIFNAIACSLTEVALSTVGVSTGSVSSYEPFTIIDKVGVVVFGIQEGIISAIYIFETRKLLKNNEMIWRTNAKKVMRDLIIANIFIVIMDIIVLFLEFLGYWGVWCSFKGMAYSMKLKVEFNILNQLKDLLGPSQKSTAYNIGKKGTYDLELNAVGSHTKDTGIVSANEEREINIHALNNNRILRTTDITLQTGQEDPKNKTKHYGHSSSPTSSTVEFAVKGV